MARPAQAVGALAAGGAALSARVVCRVTLSVLACCAATTAARAECVARPDRLVELELTGCRPATTALEEQVAGSPVWWLREYVLSIAEQVPGVLVRGTVVRWRTVEVGQTLAEWQPGAGDEEYFYPSLDPGFCAAFDPLESVLLLRQPICCDALPPADVACLLELPVARPPTPSLRRLSDESD